MSKRYGRTEIDSTLSGIILDILEDKDKYLLDVDLESDGEDLEKFEKMAEDFYSVVKTRAPGRLKNLVLQQKSISTEGSLVSMLLNMLCRKIELYEKDLVIAEDIQRNLIPEKVPRIDGYDLAAYYHPCKQIGGDYYDFYQLNHERLYFVVGDVSGHGIPSSLIVSSMQAFIYSQIQEQKSLHALIQNLNSYLVNTLITGKFTTLFIGSLALGTGALNYINAGHNPPVLLKENGDHELLTKGGPLVGMIEDITYISGYTELQDGDMLAVLTDGVTEAMNEEEEEFGDDRFLEIVKRESHLPLLGIMLKIFNALRRHCNGVPYNDDITLLFIKKLKAESI